MDGTKEVESPGCRSDFRDLKRTWGLSLISETNLEIVFEFYYSYRQTDIQIDIAARNVKPIFLPSPLSSSRRMPKCSYFLINPRRNNLCGALKFKRSNFMLNGCTHSVKIRKKMINILGMDKIWRKKLHIWKRRHKLWRCLGKKRIKWSVLPKSPISSKSSPKVSTSFAQL